VTHDNLFFFFGSTRKASVSKGEKFVAELADKYGDNDVYWIDATIISELKTLLSSKKNAADIIRKEFLANGFISALDLFKDLHSNRQDEYYFSLFELLDLCEDLLENNKEEEAETLYTVLLDRFDRFRIQNGYAFILASQGYLKRGMTLLQELATSGRNMDFNTSLRLLYYDLMEKKRIKEAIYVLNYEIERFPDSYFSYYYLAALYETQGEIDKAVSLCEKAIEIQPDYSDAKELLEKLKK
jgi:tetratricopeptide (TPR) repeat protein